MNTMKTNITAVILTKNEQSVIGRCINSLHWLSEIVIIDDFSTDNTLKIARDLAKDKKFYGSALNIFKRKLGKDFAAQRNYALKKAKNEWLLYVDADEIIPENLKIEISGMFKKITADKSGFYIGRTDIFFGKRLRFGETGKIKFIRLGRMGKGEWVGKVHEVWNIDGPIGEFKNPIIHYPHESISGFLSKINSYSELVAQYWIEQGRNSNFFELAFVPFFKFLSNYLLKLGLLDGPQGFIMAAMMSFHSFLVRSKVFLYQTKGK